MYAVDWFFLWLTLRVWLDKCIRPLTLKRLTWPIDAYKTFPRSSIK
jgi:hypothetical protein